MIKDDPIIKTYLHRLNTLISKETNFLADGKCESFEAYKRRVGIISGIQQALSILDLTIKDYENDDV